MNDEDNMQVKIAVVQSAIQQFAPGENLKRAEQFIKEAMFIQEIDTNILKDAEKSYEIRKDLQAGMKHPYHL